MSKAVRPHLLTGRINDGRTTACGKPKSTRIVVSMSEFTRLDERCSDCVRAWNALTNAGEQGTPID